MKIESILRRPGGTFVTLDDVTYHFAPDERGRHVAEVTRQTHIARFLSITEGYRLALGETPEQEEARIKAEQEKREAEAAAREEDPAPAQQEPVQEVPEDPADPPAAPAVEPEAPAAPAVQEVPAAPAASKDRAALVAAYEAKFGRKPHHKLSDEKIKQALVED